jgi:hypothetical protein
MVDGRTNIYDEERSGWPSVVSDDLVESAGQKICERWRFTISELSCEFPEISRYHKFCARLVPKMPMGARKTQGMASALTI